MRPLRAVVTFFMSGALFLSTLFLAFSPLPLLMLWQRGLAFTGAAVAGNAIVVFFLRGIEGVGFYLLIVGPVVALAPYLLLKRGWSVTRTAAVLTAINLALVGFGLLALTLSHKSPFAWIAREVEVSLKLLEGTVKQSGLDQETLKRDILLQMPSGAALFFLFVILGNVLLWVRALPASLKASTGLAGLSLETWKAPEWLIWPTLAAAGLSLFGADLGPFWVAAVGTNVLYVLLSVYALQGLSILAWCLNVWKVKGIARSIIIVTSLVVLRPLIVAIGVLDLWFDFRSRIRQK